MSLLLTLAVLTIIILGWRLHISRSVIKELIQSSKTLDAVILPKKGIIGRDQDLDILVNQFNELLAEKENMSGAGQAYHDQIQILLGNLREAVVMVDQQNLIYSINHSFTELVGIQEDPTGKRLDSLIQGTPFLEFIRDVRQEGPGQPAEIKARVNQSSRWLEVSAAPLNEESLNESQYTLFIFHDITKQKQLEKMRTEFVANVSHELRTPVTIIKGFTETLIEDDEVLEKKEKQRFLKKISNNSERLVRLIEDLMLLTRLESTDLILHKETFPLQEFLEEFMDNLRSSKMGMKGPALHLESDDDVNLTADPLRLNQVLNNLMENAYSHAKGATDIHLRTSIKDRFVQFSVADNGAGIPEKDLPHIFQRFFRVEKGRSREAGGTGLGLSIVKHIVAQHGGAIDAHSETGKGTHIEFTIPVETTTTESASK